MIQNPRKLNMRDGFSEEVKRVLAQRASLVCSNPDCQSSTGGPQDDPSKALNIGVAAHITAASQGGPRFNPALNAEQRSSANNGIWLCQNCGKLVDNDESMYTEPLLRAWKTIREHNALYSIGKTKAIPAESESERKRRELEKWTGKRVMLVNMRSGRSAEISGARASVGFPVLVIECTDFYLMVRGDGWDRSQTISFTNLDIGFDERMNCIEVLRYDR